MRTSHLAPLLLAPVLAGCLVYRGGVGATFERAPASGPRFDVEGGLIAQVHRPGGDWLVSALAVHRERDVDELGWTLLALELARPLDPPREGDPAFDWPVGQRLGLGPGLRDYGLRLEAGRSARGGYLGGALKSTYRLEGAWAITGILAAGVNTGPAHGPSAGLHLLIGFN
jgi:hypothetical protein